MSELNERDEICARLSLHRAVLEIVVANQLVTFDQRVSDIAKQPELRVIPVPIDAAVR